MPPDAACYGTVVEQFIPRPIVSYLRLSHNSHEDAESKVCLDLCLVRTPVLVSTLGSISVGLSDHQLKHVCGAKNVQWVLW